MKNYDFDWQISDLRERGKYTFYVNDLSKKKNPYHAKPAVPLNFLYLFGSEAIAIFYKIGVKVGVRSLPAQVFGIDPGPRLMENLREDFPAMGKPGCDRQKPDCAHH